LAGILPKLAECAAVSDAARCLNLVPELAQYVPPALTVDKMHYSAFVGSELRARLSERAADALIVTGAETDVCVLATVLHAVDLGQIETASADEVLRARYPSH